MGQYSLGDAIRQFLNNSRLKQDMVGIQIETLWEEIMGKTIAKYTDSIKVVQRKLVITTSVAPLKNELMFQKEKIKLRVNEALKEPLIQEVIIQ